MLGEGTGPSYRRRGVSGDGSGIPGGGGCIAPVVGRAAGTIGAFRGPRSQEAVFMINKHGFIPGQLTVLRMVRGEEDWKHRTQQI